MKRIGACLIAAACAFLSLLSFSPSVPAQAVDGLCSGMYYRIRNEYTGLYLTMANSTTTSTCSQQGFIDSDQQVFAIVSNGSYFSIRPRNLSYSPYGLGVSSSGANTIGTTVELRSSSSEIYWSFLELSSTRRYRIINSASTSGICMCPMGGSTSVGATVSLMSNSTSGSVWVLEPAYEGAANYYAIANLGVDDSAHAAIIMYYLNSIGYSTNNRIHDRPSPSDIISLMGTGRISVFHGHGSPGKLVIDAIPEQGIPEQTIYSENSGSNPAFSSIADANFRKQDYMFLGSCQSATGNEYRRSIAEVCFSKGASCVTAFSNNVAGAGTYLQHETYAIKHYSATISDAISYANGCYSAEEKAAPNHPANSNNRVTLGNTNRHLAL